MREILFRGKSVNDGEWVYGSLVVTTLEPVDDAPIKHYHIEDMTIGCFPNEFQSGLSETVDPNTVGQFTGLTDKNGKRIFEGDILGYDWGKIFRVFFTTKSCSFVVRCEHTPNEWETGDYRIGEAWCNTIRIIGNIHDNPELLEVEADNR